MDNIVEKNESLGAVGKMQHISVSRKDTIINDFKNSTIQGVFSLALSFLGLVMLGLSILRSYREGGHSEYTIGLVLIGILAIEIFSLIIGIKGLKNRKKIRHYMEKRGIAIACIVILILIGLFVWGAIRTY